MSHTDEPASTTPPASTRNPVRKRDAILDAIRRYHRAVGAVVAATAALWLNGALLSGFDTVAPPISTVTHRHSSQLSARCAAVTSLRMAQGITWRCRGMGCTCSACSRRAALMSYSRLAGSGSLLDAVARPSSLSFL